MTVAPIVLAPLTSTGGELVNARALDGQIRILTNKVNALIAALGVARTGDQIKDGSVYWRAFATTTKQAIFDMTQQLATMRRQMLVPQFTQNAPDIPVGVSSYSVYSPGKYAAPVFLPSPSSRSFSTIVAGDPGSSYRMSFRIRHIAEKSLLSAPTTDLASPYYPNTNLLRTITGQIDVGKPYGPALWDGQYILNPTPPASMVFDNAASVVWCKDLAQQIVGVDLFNFYKLTISNTIQLFPGGEIPLGGTYDDFLTPLPFDRVFDVIVKGGETFTMLRDTIDGRSAFTLRTDYPANDDPRFPYAIPYRDACAFQLDIVGFEPIVLDEVYWITDELGYPMVLTPGGYWTVDEITLPQTATPVISP